MDIRNTKRQKAFDRLLYMIVRKITDPSTYDKLLAQCEAQIKKDTP